VYDNCPTVFNPTQDATDGDGTARPIPATTSPAATAWVQALEYCDYADATIDPLTGRTLGSFCNGPADPGTNCTPLVAVEVSESAVNPDKQGILPTTVFGSPVLNLATAAVGDRPPKMIEPGSFVLEPLRASEVRRVGRAPGGRPERTRRPTRRGCSTGTATASSTWVCASRSRRWASR
jgi:hypothetical protein